MSPETRDSDSARPRSDVPDRQPGVIEGIASIVAGLIGFGLPVLGMIASCAGIWLGLRGFRQGRTANHRPTIIMGIAGAAISSLGR